MAGDEKHARELIAEAEAFTAASVIGKPTAREIDRAILLIRKLRGALEAALPGDDDWEYGVRHVSSDGWPREQAHQSSDEARADLETCWLNCSMIRRRPSGPWEPVEEVPRG